MLQQARAAMEADGVIKEMLMNEINVSVGVKTEATCTHEMRENIITFLMSATKLHILSLFFFL